nr:diphthamide biosynthesis protein 1 [Ipomoea trifida]
MRLSTPPSPSSLVMVDILSTFTFTHCFVLGDVTYGACCVVDLSSAALSTDLLIHYDHSFLMVAADMLVSNKLREGEELNDMVPNLYDGEVGNCRACMNLAFLLSSPEARSTHLIWLSWTATGDAQWIEAAGEEGQFDKLIDCDTGEVYDGLHYFSISVASSATTKSPRAGGSGVGVILLHKGFLIAIVDDVRPFPFSGVHGSRTEISHQLLAGNLDIVVASDVGFNGENLLHLIAIVVLLGVINGRVAELHTEVFQVTLFKARGQCEVAKQPSCRIRIFSFPLKVPVIIYVISHTGQNTKWNKHRIATLDFLGRAITISENFRRKEWLDNANRQRWRWGLASAIEERRRRLNARRGRKWRAPAAEREREAMAGGGGRTERREWRVMGGGRPLNGEEGAQIWFAVGGGRVFCDVGMLRRSGNYHSTVACILQLKVDNIDFDGENDDHPFKIHSFSSLEYNFASSALSLSLRLSPCETAEKNTIKAFNYINLLLNRSGPFLGFSGWFGTISPRAGSSGVGVRLFPFSGAFCVQPLGDQSSASYMGYSDFHFGFLFDL